MTLGHARETVPSSSLEGETGHGPQARKGMSVVLIDQQTLTRHCLSRSFQEGLPDLRVVAVANLADLLDASRSLRSMDLIVFNIGGTSVRDAEVLGQITWLRQHMPRVPLVLLMDRDDMDDIVEAMAQGVRGFITTEHGAVGDRGCDPMRRSRRHLRAGQYPGQVRPGSTERIEVWPERGQQGVVRKPHAAGARGPRTIA